MKSKLTEQELIDLGFSCYQETPESSGSKRNWHYYSYDVKDIALISNDSDDAKKKGWKVYLFDHPSFVLTDKGSLAKLIELVRNNTE